jgi:hypothetical protein
MFREREKSFDNSMVQSSERKFCHSDQPSGLGDDLTQLSGSAIELGGTRVGKRVHRRIVPMPQLRLNPSGSYSVRKRLPKDIREDYARRCRKQSAVPNLADLGKIARRTSAVVTCSWYALSCKPERN